MNTINDRIKEIVKEYFKSNTRAFSLHINENYQTIRNITGERASKPSSDILESIIKSIEYINPEWLLTGKGEMIKEGYADKKPGENAQPNSKAPYALNELQLIVAKDTLIERKKVIQYALYEEQKEEIKALNEELARLKGEVERLQILLQTNGIDWKQTG